MTPYQIIVVGFLAVIGGMAAVDLAGRRRGRDPAPLGTALTAALRTPVWRAVVLGSWVWIGYHFLAR